MDTSRFGLNHASLLDSVTHYKMEKCTMPGRENKILKYGTWVHTKAYNKFYKLGLNQIHLNMQGAGKKSVVLIDYLKDNNQ